MNEKMFEALLEAMHDVAEEMMFLRDEISELRNLYAQANGFESDAERNERIEKLMKEGNLFDPMDKN